MLLTLVTVLYAVSVLGQSPQNEELVQMPTPCEVCKLFSHEFMLRFNETDSSAMLDSTDIYNKRIPYAES